MWSEKWSRRDVAILNKLVRVGFTGKVVFKQKLE